MGLLGCVTVAWLLLTIIDGDILCTDRPAHYAFVVWKLIACPGKMHPIWRYRYTVVVQYRYTILMYKTDTPTTKQLYNSRVQSTYCV